MWGREQYSVLITCGKRGGKLGRNDGRKLAGSELLFWHKHSLFTIFLDSRRGARDLVAFFRYKSGWSWIVSAFQDPGAAKMMPFIPLILVCILFPAIQATQLTKCEVYQAMRDMDGHEGISSLECEFITLPFASSRSSPLSPHCHSLSSPLLPPNHPLVVF